MTDYKKSVYRWGNISCIITLLFLISIPLMFCLRYHCFPTFAQVFNAQTLGGVFMLFWVTAFLEVGAYSPLLGAGGSYLGFVTGNITNLKLPCALSAMEKAEVHANTDEGEVISTIAVASSSITTTVVLAVGVLLLSGVITKITDGPMAPAFKQVMPALFGALGASYFAKYWKLTVLPIATAVIILIFNGHMGTGTLIPICVVVSLLGTHLMYKKGWI